MTYQEYQKQLTELSIRILELKHQRDASVRRRAATIKAELERIGLRVGGAVKVTDDGVERDCIFNGVRVKPNYEVYMELTYESSEPFCHINVVDTNHEITVRFGATELDYQTFIRQDF